MQINEYLRSELVRAGFAGVELQRTPLGVRITLKTSRPGLVIGKGGKRIQEITDVLQERFGLEMPQIEVEEVPNPDLDAQIMAERLASRFERGTQYRRATYSILRRIKDAGAKGVEIVVSGKLTSHRARYKKFRHGFVAKCGDPANLYVDSAVAYAILKKGVIGINVKIMRNPDLLPNEIKYRKNIDESKLNEIIGIEEIPEEEIEKEETDLEQIIDEEKSED